MTEYSDSCARRSFSNQSAGNEQRGSVTATIRPSVCRIASLINSGTPLGRSKCSTFAPGNLFRISSSVPSVEQSATMISASPRKVCFLKDSRHSPIVPAALCVAMTTETSGRLIGFHPGLRLRRLRPRHVPPPVRGNNPILRPSPTRRGTRREAAAPPRISDDIALWSRHVSRCDRASRNVSGPKRSEEHTSELQSLAYLVCRLLLEKKKKN